MTKKKFRLTTCNICGAQAPANFMVRAKKAIKATSRNTVGGKEVIGSILGFETSQKALKRSVLTSRKRTHTTYRTVWMCEDCSGEKSIGTREQEALYYEKNALLKECELCLADIEYLRETSIPDIKSQFDKASEITKRLGISRWAAASSSQARNTPPPPPPPPPPPLPISTDTHSSRWTSRRSRGPTPRSARGARRSRRRGS